jgi:hypothetical protein
MEPERTLYLAVPFDLYDNFFQSRFAKSAISEYELRLVVYNSVEGGLVKWIG